MIFFHKLARLLVPLGLVFLVACNDNDNNNSSGPDPTPVETLGNIVDVAIEAGGFTTLVDVLQVTGLDDVLSDESATFTVFAPTDDAFAALGEDTINALLADTDTLTDILLYHVISGSAVNAETALSLAGTTVEMANGDSVALTIRDGDLFINNSKVVATDIEASNGIIHVIDAVLLPPADAEPTGNIVEVAQSAGSFTTLISALEATGLDTVLADEDAVFTVFAPTDEAFFALDEDVLTTLLADPDILADLLLYHVVQDAAVDGIQATALIGQEITMANGDTAAISVRDGALFINDAQIVTTDIPATNGVIHVIDMVLQPPAEEAAPGTIVDVAVEAGSFTTLVAALQATGLDATLADTTAQFTVFAPTDEAFAKLGQETIDALLADTETLSNILLYHVIADQVVDAATALSLDGSSVEMANGSSVTLSVVDGELFINDSKVIATDILASNGIIHVIDTVLSP